MALPERAPGLQPIDSSTPKSHIQGMNPPPEREPQRGTEANILLVGVFVFFVLEEFLSYLPRDIAGTTMYDWVYTDWLIDYSAGFVRRGLAGAIIQLLSVLAPPRTVIALVTQGMFLVFAFGYIQSIRRSLDKLNPFTSTRMGIRSLGPRLLHGLTRQHDNGYAGRNWPMRSFDLRAFAKPSARKILLKYFALPFLLSLPLYLVSWDFGR